LLLFVDVYCCYFVVTICCVSFLIRLLSSPLYSEHIKNVRSVFGWTDTGSGVGSTTPVPSEHAREETQKSHTFQFQQTLPKLPVPKLSETCKKYRKSLEPLLTDEELLKTDEHIKDFLKSGGIGEKV